MLGYNQRNENLERAHGVELIDWQQFIGQIVIKPYQKIVDLMGGCGAVASRINEYASARGIPLELTVVDAFGHQLAKAPEQFIRVLADIRNLPFATNSQDTLIVKMGLHELPLEEQKKAVKEMFRVLKEGGNAYIWMPALEDNKQQELFQWLVREKDKIAGLDELVASRYFPTIAETKEYLEVAGFSGIKQYYRRLAKISTYDKLQGDFKGDEQRLKDYNRLLRTRFNEIDSIFGAEDLGDRIIHGFPICFLTAKKGERVEMDLLDLHTK
jgi:ubiquinone/menaquinone biosynthesis C-methylase UbiE